MRLLLELPATVPTYFRGLAEQPQMAEALWATLAELRMAGIAATALPRGALASASKHAELGALLTSYGSTWPGFGRAQIMAVLAVGGEIDRIARAFERRPQLAAQIGLVLDDQHPHVVPLRPWLSTWE